MALDAAPPSSPDLTIPDTAGAATAPAAPETAAARTSRLYQLAKGAPGAAGRFLVNGVAPVVGASMLAGGAIAGAAASQNMAPSSDEADNMSPMDLAANRMARMHVIAMGALNAINPMNLLPSYRLLTGDGVGAPTTTSADHPNDALNAPASVGAPVAATAAPVAPASIAPLTAADFSHADPSQAGATLPRGVGGTGIIPASGTGGFINNSTGQVTNLGTAAPAGAAVSGNPLDAPSDRSGRDGGIGALLNMHMRMANSAQQAARYRADLEFGPGGAAGLTAQSKYLPAAIGAQAAANAARPGATAADIEQQQRIANIAKDRPIQADASAKDTMVVPGLTPGSPNVIVNKGAGTQVTARDVTPKSTTLTAARMAEKKAGIYKDDDTTRRNAQRAGYTVTE